VEASSTTEEKKGERIRDQDLTEGDEPWEVPALNETEKTDDVFAAIVERTFAF